MGTDNKNKPSKSKNSNLKGKNNLNKRISRVLQHRISTIMENKDSKKADEV